MNLSSISSAHHSDASREPVILSSRQQRIQAIKHLQDSLSGHQTLADLAHLRIAIQFDSFLPVLCEIVHGKKFDLQLRMKAVELLVPALQERITERPLLVACLQTEDVDVRAKARSMLIAGGGPGAAAVLASALNYRKIGNRYHQNLVVEEISEALVKLGDDAYQELKLGLLGARQGLNSHRFKLRALKCLSTMGQAAEGAAPVVRDMLRSFWPSIIKQAAITLGALGTKGEAALVQGLLSPRAVNIPGRSQLVTDCCAAALLFGGSERALTVFSSLLQRKGGPLDWRTPRAQISVVNVLASMGSKASPLIPLLRNKATGRNSALSEASIVCLLKINSDGLQVVYDLLSSSNAKTSQRVNDTLSRIARTDSSLSTTLLSGLGSCSDPVKVKLLAVFENIGPEMRENRSLFSAILRSNQPAEILAAASAVIVAMDR